MISSAQAAFRAWELTAEDEPLDEYLLGLDARVEYLHEQTVRDVDRARHYADNREVHGDDWHDALAVFLAETLAR